eukprot:CAMPEP_0174371294 /NCGR_PEP_ID=MMETSP0811_2-20130205/99281_1 /TAXON_ID=73025 ORGANISM="Eutreptiella gymnastica-like, Strain CCMP1594" /NCGR_SAMPLE_ID=MMETSP0811_2 /ASSEMBLY_ACC=CAM_ASM_000667 /LENGTH=62 /DNA_ID=CAMNT_0015517561 /DNA_START=206 /DNA_END=390 /DNA_ORIENTATION=-
MAALTGEMVLKTMCPAWTSHHTVQETVCKATSAAVAPGNGWQLATAHWQKTQSTNIPSVQRR